MSAVNREVTFGTVDKPILAACQTTCKQEYLLAMNRNFKRFKNLHTMNYCHHITARINASNLLGMHQVGITIKKKCCFKIKFMLHLTSGC